MVALFALGARARRSALVLGIFAVVAVVAVTTLWPRTEPAEAGPAIPTNTPTATPTSVRPPPIPEIDKTVNGLQGPITVTQGDSVSYRWVVTNAGDRPFFATVDDDTHDALDGTCTFVPAGDTCEQSAVVTLLTPGPVSNTSRVLACGIPPWPDHCQGTDDQDSVTVNVVTPTITPTPTPIKPGDVPLGGSGVFPDVPGTGGSGVDYGIVAGLLAAVTAGAIAVGYVAWYARRRLAA